jgi:hypothetical protein
MSNHGEEMSPEMRRHLDKFFQEQNKDLGLGPTGKFPAGQIHSSDKGELKLAISHKDGKVLIAFGCPTEWVGFPKTQAVLFAETILAHAKQL